MATQQKRQLNRLRNVRLNKMAWSLARGSKPKFKALFPDPDLKKMESVLMSGKKQKSGLTKVAKKLSKSAVIASVSLMVSGFPTTLALAQSSEAEQNSRALQMLSELIHNGRDQNVAPVFELRSALQRAQAGGNPTADALGPSMQRAVSALLNMKRAIEAAGAALTENDPAADVFFGTVTAYYSFKGLIHTAYEAVSQNGGTANQSELDRLDLVLPNRAARLLITFQGQQAAEAGLPVYDLALKTTAVGTDRMRLSLTAREASRFRVGAFMAFPNERTSKSALQFQALKLAVSKQTLLNTFLYSDEKVPLSLPSGADTALSALQSQGEAMSREAAYRSYITSGLLAPISDAIGSGRPNTYENSARELYRTVALILARRIDFDKLTRFVPRPLAERIVNSTGQAQAAAVLEGMDAIASRFITLESRQRAQSIREILKTSPLLFSELPREDVKAALVDVARRAVINLALIPVTHALTSLETLSSREQALLYTQLTQFANNSVKPEMITDQVLDDFLRSRTDTDVITSFRRYELAQKILSAVDWLENVRPILAQINGTSEVPVRFLPRHPDPGMTLLALKPTNTSLPIWAIEMIQSVASKLNQISAEADRRSMVGIVRATPAQLEDLVHEIQRLAQGAVMGEIAAANSARASSFAAYRWRSMDDKIRNLGRRVQSRAAKKILVDFLKAGHMADQASASSLREKLKTAFANLLDRNPEGLQALVREVESGHRYVESQHEFLQHVFGEASDRDEYLRQALKKTQIYKNYLQAHIDDIQNSLPILFTPVTLSNSGVRLTGNPNPVKLSEMLTRLRQAMNATAADVVLGQNAVSAITPQNLRNRGFLTGHIQSSLTPMSILGATVGGTRPDALLYDLGLDSIRDRIFGSAGTPTTDSMWPTKYLVRDVLPAYFDTGASAHEKARRIIVSSMLRPYIMAAATQGQAEVRVLMDPNVDNQRAYARSEAYRMLMAEVGDEAGEGLSEIQQAATAWKRRLEAVKRVTATTQEYANIWFYESMLLEIPNPEVHLLGNAFMAVSALTDLGADMGLFIDYWNTYSQLRSFGSSGVLGRGLVAHSEVENLRTEMLNMGAALMERAPTDLYFNLSIMHDTGVNARALLGALRAQHAVEGVALQNQIDFGAFKADMQKLSEVYDLIGLDVSVKTDQFKRLYEDKALELLPRLEAHDSAAKAEWERWVAARRATNELNQKYAALFAALDAIKDGHENNGQIPEAQATAAAGGERTSHPGDSSAQSGGAQHPVRHSQPPAQAPERHSRPPAQPPARHSEPPAQAGSSSANPEHQGSEPQQAAEPQAAPVAPAAPEAPVAQTPETQAGPETPSGQGNSQ